ncbi:MAG: hypothetical protein ACK526_15745 [Planctomyces sp.]
MESVILETPSLVIQQKICLHCTLAESGTLVLRQRTMNYLERQCCSSFLNDFPRPVY